MLIFLVFLYVFVKQGLFFSLWLIGGLVPGGLDSWDPLMKGIPVDSQTTGPQPTNYLKVKVDGTCLQFLLGIRKGS